ncbi:MAG TPA: T9SS type A sorting domain-containing protein, partial [Saprospiraceae bacterium]|nr:T9SS type A sorting domain-containing protein [Saprospiraceae bacterium]
NVNGTLDTTFDGDGVYTLENEMGTESLIYDMALQSDGKIIAAGQFRVNPLNHLMLLRITTGLTTATKEIDHLISGVSFYPNPVAENMVLRYSLDKAERIQISICDVMGNTVDQLLDRQDRNAGIHEEHLKLSKTLVSGYYFVKVETSVGVKAFPFLKE